MTSRFVAAWFVVALVAATAPAAAADEFDRFVADLSANPTAAAAYLRDCEMVITPRGDLRQPCALAAADLVETTAGVTFKVKRNQKQFYPRSQLEWREAEVEARAGKKLIATFHVLEVGGGGNPDGPEGWLTATHWSRVIADKDALGLARAGKLPAPAAIPDRIVAVPAARAGDDQEQHDRDDAVESARDYLRGLTARDVVASSAERGAIVFGSGPRQRYTGKKGAAAIRRWKLAMRSQGGVTVAGGAWVLWGVTRLVATTSDKAATPITYLVFAVFTSSLTVGGGSFITDPALIKFSVAP